MDTESLLEAASDLIERAEKREGPLAAPKKQLPDFSEYVEKPIAKKPFI